MFYRSSFPGEIFAELDRLQRQFRQGVDSTPSIRGYGRGTYPALNVGGTPESVEIFAFAPGLDPAKIEVNLDRGVLTISGERADDTAGAQADRKSTVHVRERFDGRFSRVVTLPDDIDPNGVSAQYTDGVLRISVRRQESAQPRRIEVH